MIRKISTQDVVSKRSEKSEEPTRRERDFLIERLSRKHRTGSIADSPLKVKKQTKKSNYHFGAKWIWFIAPIVLILILILILQFMVSAIVTITPKKATIQSNANLAASLNASTSPNVLNYQIITLHSKDSETVSATGVVATKPQKASGKITIFNNFSSASQTLIKNTRFESPTGLIYRIQNTISVPGQKVVDGKIVPGSLTVNVVADQVGTSYNIDLVDFTIPGFANDTVRFEKIFARSSTAMTGGMDEKTYGVAETDRKAAKEKIEARLRDSLLRQVQSQKTVNSIIFDAASKITFKDLPDTSGADQNHVVINEEGTISSVVFDKKVVGKVLAGSYLDLVGAGAGGSSVEVRGLESLHFVSDVSPTSPWPVKPFSFSLNGPVDLIGVVDTNKFLQDVKGVAKADLDKILVNYSTIDKVKVVLKPFWKKSFPEDTTKIKIEVVK